MFSAAKFVVAGAIVALFGGFLLTGVLTQQGEESAPAVGASASASPEIRTDILPRVDLATEQVGPRLVRILGDGEHGLRNNIVDVAVAPDGAVWVMRPRGNVIRLGEPGSAFQQRDRRFRLGSDGTLRVGDRRLEGEDWVEDKASICEELEVVNGRLGPDGTCWTGFVGGGKFARYDESGQELDPGSLDGCPIGKHAGGGKYTGIGHDTEIGPDGTVWATVWDCHPVWLASYDGSEWMPVEFDGGAPFGSSTLAVAPDGVVWVIGRSGRDDTVASWDGEASATYGTLDTKDLLRCNADPCIEFLADGSPWFGGVAELDGDTLRPIEVLAPIDGTPIVVALADGPDGSTWVIVGQRGDDWNDGPRGGLYVITPEAVAATE